MSDLLDDLDEKKIEAVKHEDGPLVIFAGPGTGKTMVTTYKIAYLVRERGYEPGEVLALTFSEKAASEMKERVEKLLPGTVGIKVSTFHSFCNNVIHDNSMYVGINASSNIIKQEYIQAYLFKHMDDIGFEEIRVPRTPTDLAKTLQGAISRFKQENITPEKLRKYLDGAPNLPEEEIRKLKDLLKAYEAYEEFKQSKNLIDFEDMQLLTLKLFNEHPDVVQRYRDQYRYIIVDEFQDTDFIQLQILFHLGSDGRITVVGDDDQSIYRFRGAYLTNLREFKQHYLNLGMEPTSIVLNVNYRCTGNIQTVASNLIKNNPERQDKDLTTKKGNGEKVLITKYSDDWQQAEGIVQKMSDRDYGDYAILVRKRSDALPIIERLEKAGIPFEVIGSREYFKEPIIRAVVSYLRLISDPIKNSAALGHVMLRPVHGVSLGEFPKVARYAREKKLSIWEALSMLGNFPGPTLHLKSLRVHIEDLYRIYGDRGLMALVRALLFGKDFFRVELSRLDEGGHNNVRLLNNFLSLTAEYLTIYPDATLEDFLDHIQTLEAIGLEDQVEEPAEGKVHLMTIHGSKGKEFPVVFVPSLNENHLPSRYQRYKFRIPEELTDGVPSEYPEDELHTQEERRLLYVAITRGKERVFLSYCDRYRSNVKDAKPSQFLQEIISSGEGYEMIEAMEVEGQSDESASELSQAIKNNIFASMAREQWQDVLDGIVALAQSSGSTTEMLELKEVNLDEYKKRLSLSHREPEELHRDEGRYSPSSLRTYESCPKKYYFQYVLKIPQEGKTFFSLGTVLHKVAEQVTRKLKEGLKVSEEEALTMLEDLWQPQEYTSETEEKQDRRDAEQMVRDFLAHQVKKDTEIVAIERNIELDIEGRKVVGKVDRIDRTKGGLEVIDYKSSKTKTSRPQLKKDFQMGLYKLAVESEFGEDVVRVGHWYLRKDEEWMVPMTREEAQAVRQRTLDIIKDIEAGKFPAKPGYDCRQCDYARLCDAGQ